MRALVLTICLAALCGGVAQDEHAPPLRFSENGGQWPDPVTFKADLPGATAWVERGSILIDLLDQKAIDAFHAQPGHSRHGRPDVLDHHAVRLRFIGASEQVIPRGAMRLRGKEHYYLGNDPSKWASNLDAYAQVEVNGLYPGVDLICSGFTGGLKYDLIIAPGADPGIIRFTYDGAEGIDLLGNELVIGTSIMDITERIPLAYQMVNGAKRKVECSYVLRNGQVGFRIGEHDGSLPMVIDPTLNFSTFSGSVSDNFGYTATFDNEGFLFSGSTAFGAQYPITLGAYQTNHNGGQGIGDGTDIAITKYDTTGTFLVWSTYLGGAGDDLPHSLIANSNDELFVFGTTSSMDFPTTAGAYDQTWNGGTAINLVGLGVNFVNGSDMIVSRLSADGSALLSSTYLGGSLNDGLNTAAGLKFNYADEVRGEVLLNAQDEVFIVSCSASPDLPTTAGAFQSGYAGGMQDGCIIKLDEDLTTILWSSFLGGSAADALYSVDIASNGDLYVAGGTASSGLFTSPSAINANFNGGNADAYVARVASNGSSILEGTYWGSVNYDQAYFVELDQSGQVHLFGQTEAPVSDMIFNVMYSVVNSGQFITKMTPDLSTLTWSTRFGTSNGTANISPTAFLVDLCNKIYISGWGSSIQGGQLSTTGLPVTPDAYQDMTTGNDFYLAVFADDMSSLTYGTYFGGDISAEHVDGGTSRFDRRGRVYQSVCAGCGSNSDFPIEPNPGAWSATNNSPNCNNGVFKFDFDAPLVVAGFTAPDQVCVNELVYFNNTSNGAASYAWDLGDSNTSILAEPIHQYTQPGIYDVVLVVTNPNACNLNDTVTAQIIVSGILPTIDAGNDTLLCGPGNSLQLLASSGGSVNAFQWSSLPDLSDTLNSDPLDSTALVTPTTTGYYYVLGTSTGNCAALDSILVEVSLGLAAVGPDAFICADDTAELILSGADPGSTIQWSPPGSILSGQGTAIVQVHPLSTTTFTVQVTAPSGCTWSGSTVVNVSTLNASSIDASAVPLVIQSGQSSQLHADPPSGVTYSWTPANLLSDPNSSDPLAFPTVSTTFYVTVTDGICTATDSVRVEVRELNCDDPDIFVPNAFSPNGDGSNDTLFVRGTFITELEFRVFDRWGEKVFETTDQRVGWDGTYKGRVADPAVFVYYLDAVCADGQTYFRKGNVTLLR